MLILLDDAADEAQIRPLLPNSPHCSVLITSRHRLTGLESAQHLDLAAFDPRESVELLDSVADRQYLGLDHDTALGIAGHCDNLPLAVRIVAARLAHYAPADAARYLRALSDERSRLDAVVAGDLRVRDCIAVSYNRLNPQERHAFRLLGLLDGENFTARSAAALLDAEMHVADELVEALVNARLLTVVPPDGFKPTRYRFPGLVRLYARERAIEDRSTLHGTRTTICAEDLMTGKVPKQRHAPVNTLSITRRRD
jgi:hypothetical protein